MMERICDLAAVPDGEILRVELSGYRPLAATLLDGRVYVFPDTCPHAAESLSKGWVEDGRVVCGVHFAEFGLADDEVVNRPVGCPDLVKFPVELKDGAVYADLSKAEAA